MLDQTELKPDNILQNITIGMSVSQSADLARLGFLEVHFRQAIAELTRTLLILGGGLAYGGHLDSDGYTAFIMQELQKYSRRDQPLLICLPYQEHRRHSLTELAEREKSLGLYGEIKYLTDDGAVASRDFNREEQAETIEDPQLISKSLKSMRNYMTDEINGRVLIGGKREQYQGEIPGIIEEVILSIKREQPVYLVGGFGGVTMDIIRTIGYDEIDWFPYDEISLKMDSGYTKGMEELKELIGRNIEKTLNNGLSEEENRLLAAAHRPIDISTLINLGLGRIELPKT